MYRCVRCPTAYHANEFCTAAGCEHLSGLDIICPRHFTPDLRATRRYHSRVNVGWCFICSKGSTTILQNKIYTTSNDCIIWVVNLLCDAFVLWLGYVYIWHIMGKQHLMGCKHRSHFDYYMPERVRLLILWNDNESEVKHIFCYSEDNLSHLVWEIIEEDSSGDCHQ